MTPDREAEAVITEQHTEADLRSRLCEQSISSVNVHDKLHSRSLRAFERSSILPLPCDSQLV